MRFTIPRWNLPALEFSGELLADVSTQEPDSLRWMECRVYKTHKGRYVTQMVGRSTVDGEHDILNVKTYSNPAMVHQGFMRVDPEEGHRYMTDAGHEALELAHEVDPEITVVDIIEID